MRSKFMFLYSYLKLHYKEGTLSKKAFDEIMRILMKEDNNGSEFKENR